MFSAKVHKGSLLSTRSLFRPVRDPQRLQGRVPVTLEGLVYTPLSKTSATKAVGVKTQRGGVLCNPAGEPLGGMEAFGGRARYMLHVDRLILRDAVSFNRRHCGLFAL